jgi:hypothetical protein
MMKQTKVTILTDAELYDQFRKLLKSEGRSVTWALSLAMSMWVANPSLFEMVKFPDEMAKKSGAVKRAK